METSKGAPKLPRARGGIPTAGCPRSLENRLPSTRIPRREGMAGRLRKTRYMYGLDALAALSILAERGNDIRRKSVTFYIANDNTIDAVVKNAANATAIQEPAGLIWHRIPGHRIAPWFGRVPPNATSLISRRAARKSDISQNGRAHS